MDELYTMNYWNDREKLRNTENEFYILNKAQAEKWYSVRKKLFDIWKSEKYEAYFEISGAKEVMEKNYILEKLQQEELKGAKAL